MKRVKVNAGKRVLVLKDNTLDRILSEGDYWIWSYSDIIEYDMALPINPPIHLNLLMQHVGFAEAVEKIGVKMNEIALQYERGLLTRVLGPGEYVFWKGLVQYEFQIVNLDQMEIGPEFSASLLQHPLLSAYVRSFTVGPNEKGVLYVDGVFKKVLEPGTVYFWRNPVAIAIAKADLRTVQLEIAGQEILTRDKAALRLNFYAQYGITDIVKALVQNKEYEKQFYVLMQLALREYVGALSLDELLEKKENASEHIQAAVAAKMEALGVELKSCGIRDIILPGDMKEIMNQVLVAEKKAQANAVMRREETASTRSLLNTAKMMEDNAMLYKLKEMEYVERIAERINTISLSGGTQLAEQLKQLFVPAK